MRLIIPQQTVGELIRILNEKDGQLKIFYQENQIMFKFSDVNFISRLIDGQFPDYQQIIPDTLETKVILDARELKKAVHVASLFTSQDSEIQLNFIKTKKGVDVLEIKSESEEIGTNTSKIKAKISGSSKKVSFNYKYVEDGLDNILTNDVCFEIDNDKAPAVLKPFTPTGQRAKDKGYTYLIMPIKTS